jgi:hypothetical protein
MEKKNNRNSNNFIYLSLNQENHSKQFFSKISYDLGDHKYTKNKSNCKSVKSLLNFITTKNKIIFKSNFDHKGSKKFLAEKAKALEECVLIDEIQDENEHIFHKKNKCHSESRHKKSKKNKNLDHYPSENVLTRFNNIGRTEKNKLLKLSDINKNNDIKKISAKSVPKNVIHDINDIGKINEKTSIKRASKKENSNKSKYSVINPNEPSYLMTGNNDSFINTIINEMAQFKN